MATDNPLYQKLLDGAEARPGGCLIWMGSCDAKGFGRVYANGMQYQAHRLSYILCVSVDIPADRLVLQTCGHRACIAPDHLFLGTQADNTIVTEETAKARRKAAQAAYAGIKINRRGM
jgi:hypothetical protein